MPNKIQVAFYTQGCRTNQAETNILVNLFRANDYELEDNIFKAEVVIINTCTVTAKCESDIRQLINKINKRNPNVRIALAGCMSEIEKEKLFFLPSVYWIVGNAQKLELPSIISDKSLKSRVFLDQIKDKSFKNPMVLSKNTKTRPNIKIQDGCDQYCSYCIVPYARGSQRSRVFENILEEVRNLVRNGYKELVLTGINLGKYEYQDKTLIDLIKEIEKIPDLYRLRISSIEPVALLDKVIDHMAEKTSKLCRFLHIPIQSAANEILKLMDRKYTVKDFQKILKKAKEKVDGICLGTDIIVGFPGETEELFKETYEFLQEIPFSYFHVFSYSARPGTKAEQMPGKVPVEVIQERSRLLRELGKEKRLDYMNRFIGQRMEVLFEQKKDSFWWGLTDNYIRVKVSSDEDLGNRIELVNLVLVEENNLIGIKK